MVVRDRTYALVTQIAAATVSIACGLAVLLTLPMSGMTVALAGIGISFSLGFWWFGWRNYLLISEAGVEFTEPTGRKRKVEWGEIESIEISSGPAQLPGVYFRISGRRVSVYVTQLDWMSSRSASRLAWLESIVSTCRDYQTGGNH